MTHRRHEAIVERVRAAAAAESDTLRVLDQVVTLLKTSLPDYTWVGIYLVRGDDLVLGPFVGKPSPHTRIAIGQGICGSAAAQKDTIVVDDVNADERYLACSVETRSEIVVPIMLDRRVLGEFDVDSDRPAAFTEDDRRLLETLAAMLAGRIATLQP